MKTAIGIKFGDNDFQNTFLPLLNILSEYFNETPTKEQVVELVNELSFGCYLACQNQFRYNTNCYKEIKEYLKITIDQVFIGHELDKLIMNAGTNLNNNLYCVYPNQKALVF